MRCRLITSWSGSTFQGLGCSPIKVVHELGSKRQRKAEACYYHKVILELTDIGKTFL